MQRFKEYQGEIRKSPSVIKQANRENNRMGKTRSLQENYRYQGKISSKDGHNKRSKCYGPN